MHILWSAHSASNRKILQLFYVAQNKTLGAVFKFTLMWFSDAFWRTFFIHWDSLPYLCTYSMAQAIFSVAEQVKLNDRTKYNLWRWNRVIGQSKNLRPYATCPNVYHLWVAAAGCATHPPHASPRPRVISCRHPNTASTKFNNLV